MPVVETVIDCDVSPVDQELPVAELEVKVTEPPEQKVVGPLAEIVGVEGVGLIVTVVAFEAAEVHPLDVVVTV